MSEPSEHKEEVAALRDRLSRLSEATLRINESLDFDSVLQEVVDSALELTGARYGAITVLDDAGQFQSLITSGLLDEENQQINESPGAPSFFEFVIKADRPLRIDSLDDFTESTGLPQFRPPVQVTSALIAPIRHGGHGVGTIYLANSNVGQEFTPEDEETLVMFASQAALVISNARTYREEQKAKDDLEALINISPVGVAVFDAKTGQPVSFNREARRMMEDLRAPDQPIEKLIEVITYRRDDGREISLEEMSLAQVLGSGETVRAEEIVLRVPDGRSVTALTNATPILAEDGTVDTVVVTLQDLTEEADLERLRAEFLGIVGHELRLPLTSIKGSATTLLESAASLDQAEIQQFYRIISEQADYMRDLISDLIDVVRIESGTLAVIPEPVDATRLVDEARNTFLSAGGRDNIHIQLGPDLPQVMADRRRIIQVLNNLLSNASSHSPETSTIRVNAVREDVHVAISVSDDGRGLPAERLPHLFRKFTRMESQDRERDLGLGLAICKGIVEAHGGRIWAESDGPGLGSRFTFTIPLAEESAIAAARSAEPKSARSGRKRHKGRTRVLAVDDDPRTLQYIRDALSNAGCEPVVTGDPTEVFSLMEANEPHVVLLDLMLPETDGIELMREILTLHDVPVIFLSAYVQDEIIARAFEMGAVDYIVKPFSPTELAARVKAAMRKQSEPVETFTLGDLAIDYASRTVTVGGRFVDLTAIEYQLLVELSVNAGAVLTHDQLLQNVWGGRGSGDIRPMRTVVKTIRTKLADDAKSPRYIFTVPRVGYGMVKAEE